MMQNILNNDPTSFAYYIQRMKDDLQHFNPITLPLSGIVGDEVEQQTKEKNAILNDIQEFQFDTLPSVIDPQYTQRCFLEQFLYAVWLEDCYNPKLRETWLEAEGHLTRPPRQEFLISKEVYAARKRLRVEETVTSFSPEGVLDDLLSMLKLHHSSRYNAMLDDPDFNIRKFVLENLAEPLHTMFENGVPTDHTIIQKLDQEMQSSDAAVYMHAFDHYRYVGQARDLHFRVHRQHMDKHYRWKNPSCHYDVWESSSASEDYWVKIADVPIQMLKPEQRGLALNIFEMLGSLMFQTLLDPILDVYLKPEIEHQTATKGLNIHLPLYQGHRDLEQARKIDDDDVWVPFNDLLCLALEDRLLENSIVDFRNRIGLACRETRLSKQLQKLIDGKRCLVTRYVRKGSSRDVSATIILRIINIRIKAKRLEQLGISWGDMITVRCELNPKGHHQDAYAMDAVEDDPANRLAIKCTNDMGVSWYQKAKGDNNAQRANALVDELEGVKIAESRLRARRHVGLDRGREAERKRGKRGKNKRR